MISTPCDFLDVYTVPCYSLNLLFYILPFVDTPCQYCHLSVEAGKYFSDVFQIRRDKNKRRWFEKTKKKESARFIPVSREFFMKAFVEA